MTQLGARVVDGATWFAVRSPLARAIDLCLFDEGRETRLAMERHGDDWSIRIPSDLGGSKYGFRAHGDWAPEEGRWFDPSKLLVDPYATQLDRRFVQNPDLATFGTDTAKIVPRAIVPVPQEELPKSAPLFKRGGLIYELNVRSFTILHPEVPEKLRGTIAALAHPAIIAHLRKLHVSAVELMPVVAWIDERHLRQLGLVNAWGYNPIAFMALDPGLCPGGIDELRETVIALHAAGIGVILDLVFNHSGESDAEGGILSLRGLDDSAYAHETDGSLTNATGTGNMLDFGNPAVRRLALDTLRHFVCQCGVDGFRFDLATVIARCGEFDRHAPIFAEIGSDPWLADRILIAEPWDVGHGGYRLGQFPPDWLEWNDRYRDDVRRFWRGDSETSVGRLATRLAGSSDIFGQTSRSVNFLSAHDGMTLTDVVSYCSRHNDANGEDNRDGHHENFSWNYGVEGDSDNAEILAARQSAIKAMLMTLFASTGPIMLTAGDEFGRTQLGNNNAYCQDNATIWLDWLNRDKVLENYVAELASLRSDYMKLFSAFPTNASWTRIDGRPMTVEDWDSPSTDGFELVAQVEELSMALKIIRSAPLVALSCRNEITGSVIQTVSKAQRSIRHRSLMG